MRRDRVNYFLVGLFVTAGLLLSLAFFYRLAGGQVLTEAYVTRYRNISGISPGTRITYEGYPVGQVGEIEPEHGREGTWYRVELVIRKDWKIPGGSIARIHSANPLAEPSIQIMEGSGKDYLLPGSELAGTEAVDLFAALSVMAGEFTQLSENGIRPLVNQLQESVGGVSADLARRLPDILSRADSITRKLDISATHISEVFDEEGKNKAKKILHNMDQTVSAFQTLAGNFLSIQTDVEKLLAEINALVDQSGPDVREALVELRELLGRVSVSSEDILMNMENTARNMNEFSRQLRTNPAGLLGVGRDSSREEP